MKLHSENGVTSLKQQKNCKRRKMLSVEIGSISNGYGASVPGANGGYKCPGANGVVASVSEACGATVFCTNACGASVLGANGCGAGGRKSTGVANILRAIVIDPKKHLIIIKNSISHTI